MEGYPIMQKQSVHRLTFCALLAAVYATLTMTLGFMSYGSVQFRIAEALCVLPFFFPYTTWGLFAGCVIANLLSAYGPVDMIFGSLATLLSCLCVAWLGQSGNQRSWVRCIAACMMPVLFNAVIVGAVIAYATAAVPWSGPFWTMFAANALSVGFGELTVMLLLGLPLLRTLPDTRFFPVLAAQ